jgi:hypothetical protein
MYVDREHCYLPGGRQTGAHPPLPGTPGGRRSSPLDGLGLEGGLSQYAEGEAQVCMYCVLCTVFTLRLTVCSTMNRVVYSN